MSAIALLFSGEEGYGRFLDLYSNHTAYNNLKHLSRRLGYLQYMDVLLAAESGSLHAELSVEVRTGRDYETSVCSFELGAASSISLQLHQGIAQLSSDIHQADSAAG